MAGDGPEGVKRRILAVDDEVHMRLFLTALFKTAGYEIMVAGDGREGLRKAREKRPDLIILDVMMPGEGGAPMYRQLKTDPELEGVPVIMLSGVSSETFLHSLKMLNLGAGLRLPEPEAYMEKPPKPQELLRLVETVLARETASPRGEGTSEAHD